MIPEIEYRDFLNIIENSKAGIIFGNGLSINFDIAYCMSRLGMTLFNAHKHIISFFTFDVISNEHYKQAITENFRAAKRYLSRIQDLSSFTEFFLSALCFAQSIINNDKVTGWINTEGYNSLVTVGSTPLEIVTSIIQQANENGVLKVNYEYWSILIYFVLVLEKAPPEIYTLENSNEFVTIALLGSTQRIVTIEDNKFSPLAECVNNGLYIYFRLLFSTNILLEGRSYKVTTLENWDHINIERLNDFLGNFLAIGTTNYDLILEQITKRNVYHLHGSYSREKSRISSLSIGVTYNSIRYDLSTITIGDYFTSKGVFQVFNLRTNKQLQNTGLDIYSKSIKKIINDHHIETLVIFGLNFDNDYHILRSIQIEFENAGASEPLIIYCYYSEDDAASFESAFYSCIKYSSELNDYVRNRISIKLLNSKELIAQIFNKQ